MNGSVNNLKGKGESFILQGPKCLVGDVILNNPSYHR